MGSRVARTQDVDVSLRITEIFLSLQGEANTVGRPTIFIRLTGCPLRCQYCDSAYAFSGGQQMTVTEIIDRVADLSAHAVPRITVTGGEPLAQPGVHTLMRGLCDQGYAVSLETSGAVAIDEVDARVVRVVDIKTPGSKEQARNLWQNIEHLAAHDQVKFVLCSRSDYEWAVAIITQHQLDQRVEDVLLSPSHTELAAVDLANWIIEDRLNVRMQVQLHKQLWGDVPGK